MDHKIKYYSYKKGASCTAIITEEGYQEMIQKYEKHKAEGIFDLDMGIHCAEDYMRAILSLHY